MPEGEDYKILNVSKDSFEDYQKIITIPVFKKVDGLNNKHLFILAMVLGFKNNRYSPLSSGQKHSGGYCRVETLSEEDRAIIKAIAIHRTKDINILNNPKELYQIAEAYANGGISILKKVTYQLGDFSTNLEAELK